MKKVILILSVVLLLSGCGKNKEEDVVKNISKKIDSANAYHMTGTLEIYRNEETYSYNIDSSYMKDEYYKVELINQNNNHKQVILKNDGGVYVLTPSLNKSFKFQSDWPNNNSQIYLLQPIINDINNDNDRTFEKTANGYIITSKTNYSTEKDFIKQKVYLDSDNNITKIEVLDSDNNIKMCLIVVDIDYNCSLSKENFNENNYISSEEESDLSSQSEEQSSKIEDVVYPMYVPSDTYLEGQDIVTTSSGERVILTFNGESSFTVIQENTTPTISTNYIYGDPYLILDTVGSITDYSVSWISNGIEYSVMSDTMNIDELLTVAQSISVRAVGK